MFAIKRLAGTIHEQLDPTLVDALKQAGLTLPAVLDVLARTSWPSGERFTDRAYQRLRCTRFYTPFEFRDGALVLGRGWDGEQQAELCVAIEDEPLAVRLSAHGKRRAPAAMNPIGQHLVALAAVQKDATDRAVHIVDRVIADHEIAGAVVEIDRRSERVACVRRAVGVSVHRQRGFLCDNARQTATQK
jgi:hypothetical protein